MRRKLMTGSVACAGAALVMAMHGPTASAEFQDASSRAPEARLEVDVSERVLRVYHGGEMMRSFPIAVGSRTHPTPRGRFRVDRLVWNPGWVPPDAEWAAKERRRAPNDPENPMVGAKLFFKYPDYYIHGTNAPQSLGSAASHGCIRMRPSDVIELGKFIQNHGGAARSDEWFDRVTANDGSSHEVGLPRPVPMRIRD